jgi:23S rRNA (uracil1939-C5)-methyltransferase
MVSIVINGQSLPHHNKLIDSILTVAKNIKDISLIVNCDNTNRIRGNEVITLFGNGYITENIDGLDFRLSPLSFFQVNTPQTLNLYRKVLEFAELTGKETVFDLYCGVGTISLFLARKALKVIGVESIPHAVNDAQKNAAINHILNADFIAGKAEEIIPALVQQKGVKADVVVVDPPRKGCDKLLIDTIIQMRPQKLIYVSCDPKSLARDLKILQDNGFKTKHVQPVDMFPHTVHVESVALVIC